MLHCMHALEEAGKAFGTKKLQDLSQLGVLAKTPLHAGFRGLPSLSALNSTLALSTCV